MGLKTVYFKQCSRIIMHFLLAQGGISELVSELLGIEHDYHGTIISNFARVSILNFSL